MPASGTTGSGGTAAAAGGALGAAGAGVPSSGAYTRGTAEQAPRVADSYGAKQPASSEFSQQPFKPVSNAHDAATSQRDKPAAVSGYADSNLASNPKVATGHTSTGPTSSQGSGYPNTTSTQSGYPSSGTKEHGYPATGAKESGYSATGTRDAPSASSRQADHRAPESNYPAGGVTGGTVPSSTSHSAQPQTGYGSSPSHTGHSSAASQAGYNPTSANAHYPSANASLPRDDAELGQRSYEVPGSYHSPTSPSAKDRIASHDAYPTDKSKSAGDRGHSLDKDQQNAGIGSSVAAGLSAAYHSVFGSGEDPKNLKTTGTPDTYHTDPSLKNAERHLTGSKNLATGTSHSSNPTTGNFASGKGYPQQDTGYSTKGSEDSSLGALGAGAGVGAGAGALGLGAKASLDHDKHKLGRDVDRTRDDLTSHSQKLDKDFNNSVNRTKDNWDTETDKLASDLKNPNAEALRKDVRNPLQSTKDDFNSDKKQLKGDLDDALGQSRDNFTTAQQHAQHGAERDAKLAKGAASGHSGAALGAGTLGAGALGAGALGTKHSADSSKDNWHSGNEQLKSNIDSTARQAQGDLNSAKQYAQQDVQHDANLAKGVAGGHYGADAGSFGTGATHPSREIDAAGRRIDNGLSSGKQQLQSGNDFGHHAKAPATSALDSSNRDKHLAQGAAVAGGVGAAAVGASAAGHHANQSASPSQRQYGSEVQTTPQSASALPSQRQYGSDVQTTPQSGSTLPSQRQNDSDVKYAPKSGYSYASQDTSGLPGSYGAGAAQGTIQTPTGYGSSNTPSSPPAGSSAYGQTPKSPQPTHAAVYGSPGTIDTAAGKPHQSHHARPGEYIADSAAATRSPGISTGAQGEKQHTAPLRAGELESHSPSGKSNLRTGDNKQHFQSLRDSSREPKDSNHHHNQRSADSTAAAAATAALGGGTHAKSRGYSPAGAGATRSAAPAHSSPHTTPAVLQSTSPSQPTAAYGGATEEQLRQAKEHYNRHNQTLDPNSERIGGIVVVPIPESQMKEALNTPKAELAEKYLPQATGHNHK